MTKMYWKRLLALIAIVSLGTAAAAQAAPNVSVNVDGKTYQCSGNGEGSMCWDACNKATGGLNFDYCANKCGGGSSCWESCNKATGGLNFDYCASKCGSGNAPELEAFNKLQVKASALNQKALQSMKVLPN